MTHDMQQTGGTTEAPPGPHSHPHRVPSRPPTRGPRTRGLAIPNLATAQGTNEEPIPEDTDVTGLSGHTIPHVQGALQWREALQNHPAHWTLSEALLGLPRGITIPQVNSLVAHLQESTQTQEEEIRRLRDKVAPPLQPYIQQLRSAMAKASQEVAKYQRQADKIEHWHHHGIKAILTPIKNLEAAIKKYADTVDHTPLITQLDILHQDIGESVIKRRVANPARETTNTFVRHLSPIIAQIRKLMQGQFNATSLTATLIAQTELEMLIGRIRRTAPGTGEQRESSPSPDEDSSDEQSEAPPPRTKRERPADARLAAPDGPRPTPEEPGRDPAQEGKREASKNRNGDQRTGPSQQSARKKRREPSPLPPRATGDPGPTQMDQLVHTVTDRILPALVDRAVDRALRAREAPKARPPAAWAPDGRTARQWALRHGGRPPRTDLASPSHHPPTPEMEPDGNGIRGHTPAPRTSATPRRPTGKAHAPHRERRHRPPKRNSGGPSPYRPAGPAMCPQALGKGSTIRHTAPRDNHHQYPESDNGGSPTSIHTRLLRGTQPEAATAPSPNLPVAPTDTGDTQITGLA